MKSWRRQGKSRRSVRKWRSNTSSIWNKRCPQICKSTSSWCSIQIPGGTRFTQKEPFSWRETSVGSTRTATRPSVSTTQNSSCIVIVSTGTSDARRSLKKASWKFSEFWNRCEIDGFYAYLIIKSDCFYICIIHTHSGKTGAHLCLHAYYLYVHIFVCVYFNPVYYNVVSLIYHKSEVLASWMWISDTEYHYSWRHLKASRNS